ncbi:unnamed protein product [Microthlaspi erraticum]|uniref:Uncharacterized protein n=1 Tax=Microthlaspi erraticum TaxID=1685480 RepID=A0A6D2JGB8_9BRAS|nr:unnamed protein product [Microthlaspi erraticum]
MILEYAILRKATMMLNAATKIDELQTSAKVEIRRQDRDDDAEKNAPASLPHQDDLPPPPKRQAHVDVLAKPLDNTDLVITRDRAVSSSHEPEKTPILSSKIERSRHHTSPIKPVSPKRESEKNIRTDHP